MLVVDTNLLILLVVGLTNPDYITGHRRLQGYTPAHFDTLYSFYEQSDEIVVLPHILAEVSNLTDQPARPDIRRKLRGLIAVATEWHVDARAVIEGPVFERLGLTDAVIFHVCTRSDTGRLPTLLTTDERLADHVRAYGGHVQDFPRPFVAR